ncbi:carbohydrate sulfotransferase 13 [Tenrec ecaudatus]|uniref:carbohydrate sulfotransferase 13 n=1 Tax=Tenrec ecaudatus TaxID=94439 RepID=UPI003F5A8313
MGRRCCRRRLAAAARWGAALLLLLCAAGALRSAMESRSLGSDWLDGKRRSPLQVLYDLEQSPRSPLVELHRQRRDLLRSACKRHTRRQRLLQPQDLRHVLVDDARGLLYCAVPQAAGTAWQRVLLGLRSPPGGAAPRRLPSLADFSPAEVNRRLNAYLAFLFVREPFERLAAAYRNEWTRPGARPTPHRPRPGAASERPARGPRVRFAARFLASVLELRARRGQPRDAPWQRAHALCHPCRLRYDVVGKFETLAEDAAFVLGLLGAGGLSFPVPVPEAQAAAARAQAARLFGDISPFYQRRLLDLYKMDFLLFNYSTPSYLRLP